MIHAPPLGDHFIVCETGSHLDASTLLEVEADLDRAKNLQLTVVRDEVSLQARTGDEADVLYVHRTRREGGGEFRLL
jgi:hypothetical protein